MSNVICLGRKMSPPFVATAFGDKEMLNRCMKANTMVKHSNASSV